MFIAIPTLGTIHTELTVWLMEQTRQNRPVMCTINVTPHSKARNQLVEEFLKTDEPYMLFVDSDTIPPPNAIIYLKEMVRKYDGVITGVTPILRNGEKRYNFFITPEDVENPPAGLPTKEIAVAGCGASFLAIPRRVLETIPAPWFKSIEFDNGNICSEDLYFCEQVSNAGFEIICDPRIVCKHYKTLPIS